MNPDEEVETMPLTWFMENRSDVLVQEAVEEEKTRQKKKREEESTARKERLQKELEDRKKRKQDLMKNAFEKHLDQVQMRTALLIKDLPKLDISDQGVLKRNLEEIQKRIEFSKSLIQGR